MSEPAPPFRRLVVVLGASRDSLATLATWAGLAARLQADLSGLFVEDADLLRMAGLPFAQLVGQGSVARAFDSETCERLLRSTAAAARAAVEAHAARLAIPWTFRTVRGVAAAALPASVVGGDLVVVEQAAFGAAAWQALRAGEASVLYLRPEARLGREVLLLDDDGDAGLFRAAAHLAAASARSLVVLARDAEAAGSGSAAAHLAPSGVAVRVEPAPAGGAALLDLVRAARGAIVVASPARLSELLAVGDELGCSILLVRGRIAPS